MPYRSVPLILRPVGGAHADDLLGGGIHVQELTFRVGDHDAVADALERGVHELVLVTQLRHRLRQLRVRLLLPGDVAEHDHAAGVRAPMPVQRPPADADEHPVRPLVVADEQLDLVRGLAPYGAHQGKLLGRYAGLPVGMEHAVRLRPLLGLQIQLAEAEDLLGAGAAQGESSVGVGDHHAVADAGEDGLHELHLLSVPDDRLVQLGLRPLQRGDVAKDDHRTLRARIRRQRPEADVEMHALGRLFVADEHLDGIGGRTAQGTRQRIVIRRDERRSVGSNHVVLCEPCLDALIRRIAGAEPEPQGAGIVEQGHPVCIDRDHALAHAVQNGLQQRRETLQAADLLPQRDLDRALRAFARVPDHGGFDDQAQLPVVEGPQHEAERVAGRRPLPRVAGGAVRSVGQKYDRDVEAAADPPRCFRAGELPREPEIDQRHVGPRAPGCRDGPAPARHRAAHGVPQVLQAFLQMRGTGSVAVDDQYLHGGSPYASDGGKLAAISPNDRFLNPRSWNSSARDVKTSAAHGMFTGPDTGHLMTFYFI